MKHYRLVRITRKNDKRDGKLVRTRLFTGPDKAQLLQAIHDYYQEEWLPYAKLAYYYGAKRLYSYDL